MSPLRALFGSPELYPCDIDLRGRSAAFVQMSPELYRAAAFHDERVSGPGASKTHVDLDELVRVAETPDVHPRPVHVVFHTAFCCSTLMTRCLERLPDFFVLREPSLLRSYCDLIAENGPDTNLLSRLVPGLLGRTYRPSETAVVKAGDYCNWAFDPIVRMMTGNAVFLFNTLRVAIGCCQKHLEWTRATAARTKARVERQAGMWPSAMRKVDVQALSDAQAATYVWLAYIELYRAVSRGPSATRFKSVCSDDFLEHPEAYVLEMCRHFGRRDVDLLDLREALGGDFFRTHAKSAAPYSAELRQRHLDWSYTTARRQVEDAIDWARELLPGVDPELTRLPSPFPPS